MNIEWTYLPNVRPYIVDGSVWAKQREDGTWVLSALLSDGSNFSGRNEGTRSDITGPIDARRGYHPAQSGIDKWEWRHNFTFADREDFKDACTPRAPKAEWFEVWPNWMLYIAPLQRWEHISEATRITNADLGREYVGQADRGDGYGNSWSLDSISKCFPVADHAPTPIGWQVVGQ